MNNASRLMLLFLILIQLSFSLEAQEPPFEIPDKQDLLRIKSAIIFTSKGEIYVELFPEDAPIHVANFKYLSEKGYYRGYPISSYSEEGDLYVGLDKTRNILNPQYTLEPEFNTLKYDLGTLLMSKPPSQINPERKSHGTIFIIGLDRRKLLDNKLTAFGRVVSGLDILKQLKPGDRIEEIKVFIRPRS